MKQNATMHGRWLCHFCAAAGVLITAIFFGAVARAQTLTWGVNGAGGSGTWNTSTANWFNGTKNVSWPSGGDAIFSGASGGTVNATFPVVSSITFNTPGYVIQAFDIFQSRASGLTVTTNADATISATLANSSGLQDVLVKNGSAALVLDRSQILESLQVNQGEVRLTGDSALPFADVTLANTAGTTVTLGQSNASMTMKSLSGGGAQGGVVQPDNQARTVTLTLSNAGTFGGTLQDNGSGVLALQLSSGHTETLTNANTYSGSTTLNSTTLTLAGNGSAANSPVSILGTRGALVLDNSTTVVANRISSSAPLSVSDGAIQLIGNTTTPVAQGAGKLSFSGASNVTVTQPGSTAAELTFAGLQRNGHATLNVTGPGVSLAGLANGGTGIVPPYVTAGNEWATVGGDGRIAPLATYATDINAGSTSDHVKLSASGTTSLAAATTRASLNLQNGNAAVGQVFDLAGQSLGLTSGGILSSGAGSSTIRNGNLSTTAGEMVVTANNNLTIGSSIIDNGNTTTLTKSGTGVLTLAGSNSYTGPTAIMQGTLVVASDANLGLGSSIELGGRGTLRAGGSFSSTKGITSSSTANGTVDTAGFNIAFSGGANGNILKNGLGTLTLSGVVNGFEQVNAGLLVLPSAPSSTVLLLGGNLQASGNLSTLITVSGPGIPTPILDLGGPAAATLTSSYNNLGGNLLINFGIGSAASDFWAISSLGFSVSPNFVFPQFEFSNLGGVATGIDYPLMSFPSTGSAPSASDFAFAPDMAAAGWAGTFHTTTTGVSVDFSAVPVPEPNVTAILLLQGAVLACLATRLLGNRRTIRKTDASASLHR